MIKYKTLLMTITLLTTGQITAANAEGTLPPPPNQLGPVYDYDSYSILEDNDPNIVKEVDQIFSSWSKQPAPAKPIGEIYWQRRYHRQVNAQVFQITRYPFYPKSQSNSATPKSSTDPDTARLAQHRLELIFNLIHQWRNINESEAAALEIRYAIELTKTTTSVYQNHADLAIQVKRTLGRIGRINAQFDQVSRQSLTTILQNEPIDIFKTRLEKQIADLENLLYRLAEHNDAISMALGKGRIQRITVIPDYLDKIDYSAKNLPDPTTAIKM
jgi:hypothetical protein